MKSLKNGKQNWACFSAKQEGDKFTTNSKNEHAM
jgi:hypothetical protein